MYLVVLEVIWIGIAIGSAIYIYHNTKKDRGLWTILGLLLGVVGFILWRLVGPGQYK